MKQLKLILLTLVFILACDETSTDPDLNDKLAQGWTAFENHDYGAAQAFFAEAFEIDDTATEGIIGLGLSYAKLGELDSALFYTNVGIAVTDTIADWYAAKGFILNAKSDFVSSNTQLAIVSDITTGWSFDRGLNLNMDNIYATRAVNYFQLNDVSNAINMIRMVDPSFSASASDEDVAEKIQELNTSLIVL